MSKSKYQEIKLIGKGEFSNLYEGINKETNEKVALKKIVKSRLYKNNQAEYLIGAIQKEIEIMKLCQCENTVKFYDYYEEEDYYVIVMELCDSSLISYYKERKIFSLEEIFELFSNLNKAFKIMHDKKIVLRDLKLENILIKYSNKEKTEFIPKIYDFGLSKQIKQLSKNTRIVTTYTLAPEVYNGREYDSKADLWSLGVILYFCYFKEYPYSYNQMPDIVKANKLEYKKPNNIFLADLIDKLLVISPENRISWKEYFNHPFFKVFSFKEFNIGFKVNFLKYYIAKYKEDDNNIKNVLIKEMYQNNLENNFYYNDFSNHKLFSNNDNVLKLITPIEFKDRNNKQIIYLIYECDEKCIPLEDYCKNHNFSENEMQKFNKNFFDIFKRPSNFDIFISIYSFVVYPNWEIKLIDFGLNKKYLTNEEIKIYYAPNEREIIKSENPSKTCLMNYGITLLKMINNNDNNIFFTNNKFNLKSKRIISQKFNSFLSKCLCNDIKNRPNWNDLKNDEFLNIYNNKEKQSLLNEKQFEFFLNYYIEKYKSINDFYNIIDINNSDNIEQNEDFLILTIYEIQIIKEILLDENNFNKNDNQITLLSLPKLENNNKSIPKLVLNSQKCLNINLITNTLCKEKRTKFINELNDIVPKLINIIKNINKNNDNNTYLIDNNEISNDFLENLIKNFKHFNLQDFCLSFVHNFSDNYEKEENIDYNKALKELNYSKYIIEFLLFLKESIKENDEMPFNKRYESKEELLKDINNYFIENEKNNYILISLIYDKLLKVVESYNDEDNILVKDNKNSLSQLIHFYPIILKLIDFVNSKIN